MSRGEELVWGRSLRSSYVYDGAEVRDVEAFARAMEEVDAERAVSLKELVALLAARDGGR